MLAKVSDNSNDYLEDYICYMLCVNDVILAWKESTLISQNHEENLSRQVVWLTLEYVWAACSSNNEHDLVKIENQLVP